MAAEPARGCGRGSWPRVDACVANPDRGWAGSAVRGMANRARGVAHSKSRGRIRATTGRLVADRDR